MTTPDKVTLPPRSNLQKNVAIAVILAAVVFLIVYIVAEQGEDGTDVQSVNLPGGTSGTSPRTGSAAPDFAVVGLDGTTFRLSDLRGKPVWLNFWATWCPPCRAEMPDIDAVQKQKAGEGLIVLAISQGEDRDTVRRFIEANGYSMTIGLDPDQTIGNQYRVMGIPAHFFIDKNGVIRDAKVGGLKKSQMLQKATAILGS